MLSYPGIDTEATLGPQIRIQLDDLHKKRLNIQCM